MTDTGKKGNKPEEVNLELIGKKEEQNEGRTVASRDSVRKKIADDIEAYLSQGGTIDEVAPDVTADPPKKPENNYGSRAI